MAGSVEIITADVLEGLRGLPDDHFQSVVTSPPYWGLRDYGVAGQLGMEPTLGAHLEAMVAVFAEVWRVLRPDGVLWLNYGDCYASTPNGRSASATKAVGGDDRTFRDKPFSTVGPIYDPDGGAKGGGTRGTNKGNASGIPSGRIVAGGVLKPKDLCMIPNRLAIALQEAGWWVRSEIYWAKPNPMPESVTDRPATAHEKIFMLTKSARYTYYPDAVRAARNTSLDKNPDMFRGGDNVYDSHWKMPDGWDTGKGAHGSFHKNGREKGKKADKQRGHKRRHDGFNDRWDEMTKAQQQANGRNLRNWEPPPHQAWIIATKPYSGAHFATFPPELVERCLKASTQPGDFVIDPFGGAGTTGLVAAKMGCDATLIEINPDYVDQATGRLRAHLIPVEADVTEMDDHGPLFDLMQESA